MLVTISIFRTLQILRDLPHYNLVKEVIIAKKAREIETLPHQEILWLHKRYKKFNNNQELRVLKVLTNLKILRLGKV